MITALVYGALALVAVTAYVLIKATRVFKEDERAVVFRLGRVLGVKEPGLTWVWPIDRVERVSLKSVAVQVPRQSVMTKDGLTVGITLALYIRVVDPVRALTEVDDYEFAAQQAAETALRGIVSHIGLDEVLLNRDKVNQLLQEGIERFIKPFGIVVWLVEVNDIELSAGMRQAMARDAEAERDRSSQVIKAQGESAAADALNHAAEIMKRHPAAMQLRILSAMAEVAGAQNTTVIIPVPVCSAWSTGSLLARRPSQEDPPPLRHELDGDADLRPQCARRDSKPPSNSQTSKHWSLLVLRDPTSSAFFRATALCQRSCPGR